MTDVLLTLKKSFIKLMQAMHVVVSITSDSEFPFSARLEIV